MKKDNFTKNFYNKFIVHNLSLSDQLAATRSILANERTFLSYQRTALTLFLSGMTFVKFFETTFFIVIGWIFIPASFVTMLLGVFRYLRMRDLILSLEYEKEIQSLIDKPDK